MLSSHSNPKSDNNSFQLIHRLLSYTLSSKFFISYIVSMVLIIFFGYVIKNHQEIEKYKQITVWYEDLDLEVESTKTFADFVEKAQNNLQKIYKKDFKNYNLNVSPDLEEKIIIDNKRPKSSKDKNYVTWKIEKIEYDLKVFYGYSGVLDFQSEQNSNSRSEEKAQIRTDKIFQTFTQIMGEELDIAANNGDTPIQNFHEFSKKVIGYLTGDDDYWKKIPDLRINSVYILNTNKDFLIYYPFTSKRLKEKIDYETRPWYRATERNYNSSYEKTDDEGNKSGLTGIYIDLNDNNKPNAIRTLWYKFKVNDDNNDNNDKTYILCLDIFMDKSHQIVQEQNLLYLLEEPLNSVILVYLLPLSAFMALSLSLLYEFRLKPILFRLAKHNDVVPKIKLKRESKHYAGKDEGEIKLNIKGETKAINRSEQSREAGWNLNDIIPNLEFSAKSNESNAREQEASFSYEFTKVYDLSMLEDKPQYRCIETWRVLSEYQSGKTQTIGLFVAHWNTNNSADLEQGLDIKSIYWEQDYEYNLESLKKQLKDHLLISEKRELVPVLDPQYTRRQTIPPFFEKIDSLKTLINTSSYLQQGKIVFSEICTLAELYKEGTVKAICSLHFLTNLKKKQQLKDFLDVPVAERYLIEYEEDEFRDFYDSLDDETKSKLINQYSFKIMVYQDDIDNIISPQDDFCIISLKNGSKLVAYSFTDDQYSHTSWLGWISWREVDSQFYDELYKCQLNKTHLIKTIRAYIEGKS
ncbi:hypothetical protein BJP34_04230 [Moorena producens PAL-8-15-08-1]|uniref:Uncharacterized protein n=2 Tax=Moorena TaxID=1155738 RepID=A0A1D8TMG6_9CYAN|nr:hypothetical protein BJP34_04230 [Moorena producens PAL-8-15-08-1]